MSDTSSLAGSVNSTNIVNNTISFTGPTGADGSGFTGPTGAAGLAIPKFSTRFTTGGIIPSTANIWFGQPSFNGNDDSTIVPGTFSGNGSIGTTFTFSVGGTYDISIVFVIISELGSVSINSLLKIMNGGTTFYQGYSLTATAASTGARATSTQRVIVKDVVAGYTMFVGYTSSGSISLEDGGTMTILQVGS